MQGNLVRSSVRLMTSYVLLIDPCLPSEELTVPIGGTTGADPRPGLAGATMVVVRASGCGVRTSWFVRTLVLVLGIAMAGAERGSLGGADRT